MSGGVDSSVSCYLLLKEGYEVIGVSLKYPETDKSKNTCCGIRGIEDAKKVAEKLCIPFYVLDYEEKFKEEVIKYFVNEYLKGRTPNPCVVCNKNIKFGELLKFAKALGIDYVATGHYVRKERIGNRYILKKARDLEKDQSYFLYSLTQIQLQKSIFPLGDYKKEDVRRIAKEIGLHIHNKPQSQDICFLGEKNYREFISKEAEFLLKPGKILNEKGEVLGTHKGIAFYTIGQRKGIGVFQNKPLYVIKIDSKNNTIVVGNEEELYRRELIAENVNLIPYKNLEGDKRVTAKIRYKQAESEAIISPLDKNKIKVVFLEPQRAITPGQSVVFYEEDILVGGGIISEKI
jgi:tRNA-specific 2-thiouridylase